VAPTGYSPAPDYPIEISIGQTYTVGFTNPRAVGGIEMSLADDATPPQPLAGGTFEVLADDGDGRAGPGDTSYATCTTEEAGACVLADVPLGPYVVRQTAAPTGYQPSEPVAFTLGKPGQVARLAFVNGLAGTDGSADDLSRGSTVDVSFDDGPGAPLPVVSRAGQENGGGPGQLLRLPRELLGFLLRRPFEGLLFGFVWLLMGAPAYLGTRRRVLRIVREGAMA
jgi:hypothetical protein